MANNLLAGLLEQGNIDLAKRSNLFDLALGIVLGVLAASAAGLFLISMAHLIPLLIS